MNIDTRLTELGLTLPPAPKPIASYVPAVRSGTQLYISGQLPFKDGNLTARGKVSSAIKIDEAQAAAQQAILNALSIIRSELAGDWNRLRRIVRIGVFVQSDDTFNDQAQVANGASDLLIQIFGEMGRHARAAVGVNALPLNAAVEIEMLVEIN